MSDDLVILGDRLREIVTYLGPVLPVGVSPLLMEAADALVLQSTARARLQDEKIALHDGLKEVTEKYIDEADERVKAADASREALAAKLAEAVELLRYDIRPCGREDCDHCRRVTQFLTAEVR